jgi:hypothetical protein
MPPVASFTCLSGRADGHLYFAGSHRRQQQAARRRWLTIGIGLNLLPLTYTNTPTLRTSG